MAPLPSFAAQRKPRKAQTEEGANRGRRKPRKAQTEEGKNAAERRPRITRLHRRSDKRRQVGAELSPYHLSAEIFVTGSNCHLSIDFVS
jgi:hypothetical protein